MNIVKNKSQLIFYSLIFVFGITLGLLINDLPHIKFRNEVSILEISNLLLTIFLTFYIPFFHNKYISNKRVEKDLYIDLCTDQKEKLTELNLFIEQIMIRKTKVTKDESTAIILKIKNLRTSLSQIFLIKHLYQNNTELNNIIKALTKTNNEFWKELTKNLSGNNPKISITTYNKTQNNFYKYQSELIKLKTIINSI